MTGPKCPAKAPAPPEVKLRDTIGVRITGLATLRSHASCLEERDGTKRQIILYLDRRPLPSLVGEPPTDPSDNVLMFPLSRTEKSREVWTSLLGSPGFGTKEVEVSVGLADEFAVGSDASIELRVIPKGWFAFWVVIFLGFALGFYVLARRSDVLRDPVTAPAGARPPYSLSRLQAAWWFFLILAAYLLIGLVTGDFTTSITGTVLTLLGISAGTVTGSAFVDAGKTSAVRDAVDAGRAGALWAELQTLAAQIAGLAKQVRVAPNPVNAHELAVKEAVREEKWSTYQKITRQSQGFLIDILSDSAGVNFHRFQMFAWTIVLGIIFGVQVYHALAMPQFNETLLALMGISAGTYIGLKIPENGSPSPVLPDGGGVGRTTPPGGPADEGTPPPVPPAGGHTAPPVAPADGDAVPADPPSQDTVV